MDFIERMDNLLIEKNIKRETLAEYVGLSVGVFSMWKKRKTYPRADIAVQIAKYLGVSTEYLITGQDLYSIENKRIIEVLNKLSNEQRTAVLTIIDLYRDFYKIPIA
jgi:transcriptional regulator with XRE-family HTH domain